MRFRQWHGLSNGHENERLEATLRLTVLAPLPLAKSRSGRDKNSISDLVVLTCSSYYQLFKFLAKPNSNSDQFIASAGFDEDVSSMSGGEQRN